MHKKNKNQITSSESKELDELYKAYLKFKHKQESHILNKSPLRKTTQKLTQFKKYPKRSKSEQKKFNRSVYSNKMFEPNRSYLLRRRQKLKKYRSGQNSRLMRNTVSSFEFPFSMGTGGVSGFGRTGFNRAMEPRMKKKAPLFIKVSKKKLSELKDMRLVLMPKRYLPKENNADMGADEPERPRKLTETEIKENHDFEVSEEKRPKPALLDVRRLVGGLVRRKKRSPRKLPYTKNAKLGYLNFQRKQKILRMQQRHQQATRNQMRSFEYDIPSYFVNRPENSLNQQKTENEEIPKINQNQGDLEARKTKVIDKFKTSYSQKRRNAPGGGIGRENRKFELRLWRRKRRRMMDRKDPKAVDKQLKSWSIDYGEFEDEDLLTGKKKHARGHENLLGYNQRLRKIIQG